MPKKESSPTDSFPAAASPTSLSSARNVRRLDLPLEDIIDIHRKSIDQLQLEGTRRKSLDPPHLEDVVVVDTRRQSHDQPPLEGIPCTHRKLLVLPYLDEVVNTRRKLRDPSSIEMVDADNLNDDNPLPVSS